MDHRAAGFESQRAGLLIDLNEMTGSCAYLHPNSTVWGANVYSRI